MECATLLLQALDLVLRHDMNFCGDSSLKGKQFAAVELVLWAIGEPPTPQP